MKLSKLFILTVVIAALSGCSALFDQNSRQIAFKKGVPYYLPYGTNFGLVSEVPKPMVDELGCGKEDVLWINSDYFGKFKGQKNAAAALRYLHKLSDTGNAGCESPMSDKEFEYRKGDKARRENNAAAANAAAANAVDNSTVTNCYGSGSSVQCYSY